MRTAPVLERPVLAGVLAVVARLQLIATRWVEAHENRRAARQLALLDRRLLADIGIDRGDVMAALERPLDDDPTLHLARLVRERRRAAAAQHREARDAWGR